MHEVVRAGRADGHQPLGLHGAHELDGPRGGVQRQDLVALGRHRAAHRRQQVPQQSGALLLADLVRIGVATAEAREVPGALVDERDRLVDHVDRPPVGLLGAVAPHHQPVLGEHDELELGIGAGRLPDLLGEREAGADVGNPRGAVAEALPHQAFAIGCAGQHVDAVRVRVVHVGRRHERVQQRLYRAARHRRIELTARQVGDHLLVAHLPPLDQREHLVELEPREVLGPHRGEVGTRALDPHHTDLTPGVVSGRALRRRVPTAEVRDRAIRSEQVGGQDELREDVLRGRAAGGPEVFDVVDERGHGAHRVISCAASRSRAARCA